MKKFTNMSVGALLAAGIVVGATACGGGAKAGSDPAAAPTTQSNAPAQTAPTVQPAPTAAAAPNSVTLVASNLLFDKKELQAAAGDVAIEFDNQDASVPHNVHVFAGGDATGTSAGTTTVEPGPIKQSLSLKLAKGAYFFQCDVHPTTMTGTLTVE